MQLLGVVKQVSAVVLVCLTFVVVQGQTNYGLGTSNYLTSASTPLNPGELGRMKHKWYVSPFALNARIHNNYLSLDMPYSPYRLLNNSTPDQYRKRDGKAYRNWNWVSTNSDVDQLNFYSSVKIEGPAIYARHKNWVYGLSNEVNVFAQVLGLPSHLADDQLKQLQDNRDGSIASSGVLAKELEKDNNIQLFQNIYHAINLSIARSFELKNDRNLSIGVTYKVINSVGGLSFLMQTQGVQLDTQSGHFHFSKPKVQFTEYYARNNKLKPHGFGGLDLGFVYTFRNKETRRNQQYLNRHTDYKYKLGFSILDMGKLVYTRTIRSQLDIDYNLDLSLLDKFQNADPNELFKELEAAKLPNAESTILTTYGEKIAMGLPTRMILNFDFQVFRRFYLSTLFVQSLRKKGVEHLYMPNLIQITPRIEGKYMELGLPLSIRKVRPTITQGLTLRVFNFFISTQNVIPFFTPQKAAEASVFFGIQISNLPGKFYNPKYTYRKFSKKGCSKF